MDERQVVLSVSVLGVGSLMLEECEDLVVLQEEFVN